MVLLLYFNTRFHHPIHRLHERVEYKCFTDNLEVNESGLRFNNVYLSDSLTPYFTSVKQVSELKLTQVQLSFNRNKPRIGFQDQNAKIGFSSNAKRIFYKLFFILKIILLKLIQYYH